MERYSATDLEQSILKTLAWFSLMEYPVTVFELWKWLLGPRQIYTLGDVYACIDESKHLRSRVRKEAGFLALDGAKPITALIEKRHGAFLNAIFKFAKMKKLMRYIALLPSIRSVAICNTLAWYHTNDESDIDFFITVRPGWLWTTRLFLVTPFALLGKRPHSDKNVEDPLCFSFFTSTNELQLEQFTLDGGDPYFNYWLYSLVPILDREHIMESLYENNTWAQELLPNTIERASHHDHFSKRVSLPVFLRVENLARSIQQKRFPDTLKELANKDTRVVITDDTLKFHSNDRRELFREQLKEFTDRVL